MVGEQASLIRMHLPNTVPNLFEAGPEHIQVLLIYTLLILTK
jgi:hypothetical protein